MFTGCSCMHNGQAMLWVLRLDLCLQFADGEILMHVFDISYNQLSGPLPSFLDFTNVPEYTQRGIFISVSLSSTCLIIFAPTSPYVSFT